MTADINFLLQIGWPDAIETRPDFKDVRAFIRKIATEVKKCGGEVIFLPHANPPWTPKGFSLNFHGYGFAPNTYFYKEAFLRGWIQIDANGHSGYFSQHNFDCVFNQPPRFNLYNRLKTYANNGDSKYSQPKNQQNFQHEGFVFFPLQKPQDETSLFQSIDLERAIIEVSNWCKDHDLRLIVKRHPFDHSNALKRSIKKLADENVCEIVDGNVTELIDRANLLVTFNSSVGFEALIRGRPVVCLAPSEYSKYTFKAFTADKIQNTLNEAFNFSSNKSQPKNGADLLQVISHELAPKALFEASSKQDVKDFVQFALLRLAATSSFNSEIGSLNASIKFCEESACDHYKLNGFSYSEDWGSWTTDDYSSLVLNNQSKRSRSYEMKIKVRGYVNERWPVSRFRIFVNREEQGQFEISAGDGDKEFVMPALFRPGLNTITIQNLDLVRPVDLGTDFDARRLGVGVISLDFV